MTRNLIFLLILAIAALLFTTGCSADFWDDVKGTCEIAKEAVVQAGADAHDWAKDVKIKLRK